MKLQTLFRLLDPTGITWPCKQNFFPLVFGSSRAGIVKKICASFWYPVSWCPGYEEQAFLGICLHMFLAKRLLCSPENNKSHKNPEQCSFSSPGVPWQCSTYFPPLRTSINSITCPVNSAVRGRLWAEWSCSIFAKTASLRYCVLFNSWFIFNFLSQ